jgi:hypothetical protein
MPRTLVLESCKHHEFQTLLDGLFVSQANLLQKTADLADKNNTQLTRAGSFVAVKNIVLRRSAMCEAGFRIVTTSSSKRSGSPLSEQMIIF